MYTAEEVERLQKIWENSARKTLPYIVCGSVLVGFTFGNVIWIVFYAIVR